MVKPGSQGKRGLFHLVFGLAVLAALLATGCDSGSDSQEGNPPSACADLLMIDDMEDGDGFICRINQRGIWYTIGDGTSDNLTPEQGAAFTPTLIPEGRGTSRYAARMTGSGFTDWGALMGMRLSASTPYDASAFSGIKFWMKSKASVTVAFSLPTTIPMGAPAGTCVVQQNCNNAFHFWVAVNADGWAEYEVPFAALRQGLFLNQSGELVAGSATWDASQLVSIHFAASGEFDVWIDDVQFYSCAVNDCVPTCRVPGSAACPASDGRPADCWPAGTCSSPPDLDITGIWGSAPDDVWAVGYSRLTAAGNLLHWDGSTWSRTTRDDAGPLWGVWGSDASNVWAVGERDTLLHWDGAIWSATKSGTGSSFLQGVWGSGPRDVWAAGLKGAVVHWDGSVWSSVASGTIQDLWGVWGSGPGEVWAVGVKGALPRWDGSAWSPAVSGTDLQLDGVWGSGPDDVWAVGDRGTILHWNGSAWSAATSGTTAFLDAVWGSGPDDVWAVGELGTILHWNGSAWFPVASGTNHYLYSVWGSGSNDVWAVGDVGKILHWDGSGWSTVPLGR